MEDVPPGIPSSASSSGGVSASRPSSSSSIGSASTLFSERRVAATARSFAPARANSRAGMWSPNSVSVWIPRAFRSSDRMLGSVSEWQ